ncbi:unnamed protein product [Ambrosiozyma monospora]|uniref:Unnamed protein product n=1 Tax=Ambrosiozyma monospora TaxID=43982 RepID=A0ACB5SW35_AMBMO|nr:unnamed protein product [Ambrosiozyma monospora]
MPISYPLSPPNAVSLASQLPLEVQFVILKDVMVNFLNSRCSEEGLLSSRRETHHDMLAQFVSMLGYSTSFDTVLSMAIPELNLDNSIFSSLHFEQFAKFVITRSLQIKSLQIDPALHDDANLYNSPDIIRFLEFHCQTVVSIYQIIMQPASSEELLKHSYYVKFINHLEWSRGLFFPLYHSGLLSQLHRLRKLLIPLRDQGDITMLNDIIKASWFRASTKLILKVESEETSDAVYCLSKLSDIIQRNEKLDITLDIDLTLFSHLVIDALSQLILHPIPISNMEFYAESNDYIQPVTALLNKVTNTKRISLVPDDTMDISNIIFSNESLSTLQLIDLSSPSEFVFHDLHSLKHLDLINCSISWQAMSKLPENLEVLDFDCVALTGNGLDCTLPLQLRKLNIFGNPSFSALPVILNASELHDLDVVIIYLDPAIVNPYYISEEDPVVEKNISNTFTITQLQDFISQLPSSLSSFEITSKGYLRVDFDSYSLCCPDKLSFSHFTNLKKLKFDFLNHTPSFDVSIFPDSLETLDFTSSKNLTGLFPSNLITLSVDLGSYDESLTYFLNTITNLTNLVTLRTRIPEYQPVDLRGVKFPPHLCSFELDLNLSYDSDMDGSDPTKEIAPYIVLDEIPLNYFRLPQADSRHIIVVDGSKGENIESMKRQIHGLSSECGWVQYSRLDDSETDPILDSLHTLFDICGLI